MNDKLTLQELGNKIRKSIPELKEEFEAFEDGSIDRDMITQVGLNHVLEYSKSVVNIGVFCVDNTGEVFIENRGRTIGISDITWNLKSAYLKDQSEELITFLNELE